MIRTVKPDWIIADAIAHCSKAPVALVQRALMRAARAFAKTCVHTCWIDIPTQANVQKYPFERYLPEGFDIEYVLSVEYNGCCIECVDDQCGTCLIGYTLDDLCHITLHGYCPQGVGSECETLRVQVVLRINSDACELPKDLVDRFEEPLLNGTLANLMAMKDQAWTDFRQAEFYENQFKGDIASAKCLVDNKMNPRGARMQAERLL